MKTLSVEEFLELSSRFSVLDVRSPSEYSHAHIPFAHSFPIFSDEERKVIGTAYKQESREKAIKIGLDFFGPKMRQLVEKAEKLDTESGSKTFLIHCWRGGMRSQTMAWLLNLYGFKVYLLDGGYKSFRNWTLRQFEKKWPLLILGGYTGSGKTEILHLLQENGESVIDLEGLANHRGSAFGHLGQPTQPTVEMFENKLATELWKKQKDSLSPIWLEAESQRIGKVNIPGTFFEQIKNSPILRLEIPFEERHKNILNGYGKFEKEDLIQCVLRIRKRLGGLETKNCINHLLENQLEEAFTILLRYYDRWYDKSSVQPTQNIFKLVLQDGQTQMKMRNILDWKKTFLAGFIPQNIF